MQRSLHGLAGWLSTVVLTGHAIADRADVVGVVPPVRVVYWTRWQRVDVDTLRHQLLLDRADDDGGRVRVSAWSHAAYGPAPTLLVCTL